MVEEQRTHPRVDVEPDFCVLATSLKEHYLAVVRNLSRSGALVDVGDVANNHAPPLADAEVVFTSTPLFLRDALQGVRGKTVWVRDALLGIRFDHPLSLPEEDLDVIREHLEAPEGPDWQKF